VQPIKPPFNKALYEHGYNLNIYMIYMFNIDLLKHESQSLLPTYSQ